jgi:hypothetical protein
MAHNNILEVFTGEVSAMMYSHSISSKGIIKYACKQSKGDSLLSVERHFHETITIITYAHFQYFTDS